MKLHELLGITLAMVLLLVGCNSKGGLISKPKTVRSDAPEYRFRDGRNVRRTQQLREYLGLAGQNLAAGALNEAERNAKAALRIDPQSTDAMTMMALIEGRRGNNQEAGRYYQRAAESAPQRGEVLNNYGAWLCISGYAAESLIWFDRALTDPDYSTPSAALANAGGCAFESGQYERAEDNLRKALDIDPNSAFALASMARNEYRKGAFFSARAFLERRLAAAPADASVLQLGIQIEQRLGDRAAANRYLQRLRAEFPESAVEDTENNPS